MSDPHLPHALRILARDLHCEDGIATQCIREAADEIDRLRRAITRLAQQDATLSVCDGAVTVTMDGTLTDAEREAVELAIDSMSGVEDISASWSQREMAAIATLRGLLERISDRPQPIATPGPPCTPAECTVPPEWTSKPYWVDPPSGWRHGFPKLYDPAKDGDMRAWMIANGYPEKMANLGLPCTFTEWTDSALNSTENVTT